MPGNSVPIVNTSRPEQPPDRLILVVRRLSAWLTRRNTRAALSQLNDRDLRDIGIERAGRGYRVVPGSAADYGRHRR